MAEESGAAGHPVPENVPVEDPAQLATVQSPAKRRKTVTVSKEEVWGSKLDQWVQAKDQLIPLDELEVGVGIEKGQVRQLRQELVQKRLESLEQVPPDRPVDVTVWNPSVANPSMSSIFFVVVTCLDFLLHRGPQGSHQRAAHGAGTDGTQATLDQGGEATAAVAEGREREGAQT